jgi:hypothetical protein
MKTGKGDFCLSIKKQFPSNLIPIQPPDWERNIGQTNNYWGKGEILGDCWSTSFAIVQFIRQGVTAVDALSYS